MTTTLIFVRHGQSLSNLGGYFTGNTDVELTELGHRQAELTAEYLDRYRIDHIYSSDLSRAYQTAEHTAARKQKAIVPDQSFREIYAGEWEGKSFQSLPILYPQSYDVWKNRISRACPDGGERVTELSMRVWGGVTRVLERHRGETVAIFTHATPVRTLAWRWFGFDIHTADEATLEKADALPFCSNASVSVVEYEEDGSFRLICYGYDEHLADVATALPKHLV